MAKIEKFTGSVTISKLARKFFPSGVTHGKLILDLDATTREGTVKRATNNLLSLTSLCYALLKSGVVAEANLANILLLATDSKDMSKAETDKLDALIDTVKAQVAERLPMVPVEASLIVEGVATVAD